MKDFQDVIEANDKLEEHIKKQIGKPKEAPSPIPLREKITTNVLPVISPFLLSIVTGPFSTASTFLQTTSAGIGSPGFTSKLNAQPNLSQHIMNGIFGDNKIYTPPSLSGYREAMGRLGRQGIRGLYKGNFTAVFLAGSNASLRSYLYGLGADQNSVGLLSQNLITIASCSLADLVTLPLMTAQSRLVLQNSSSHFRTYSSFFSVWRHTSPKMWFSGGSLLLFKNILFDLSWIKMVPESPVYSFIISSSLCHLLTYPFLTVMRQMQVNDPSARMMQNRSESVRQCLKRLRQQGGIRSFYRGFLAYAAVHLFMGGLMVQVNMRSGYFLNQTEQ